MLREDTGLSRITNLAHGWWISFRGILGIIIWIEIHQPWARFVIPQSLTTKVVQIIIPLSKSTLSPDEDLLYAVETSPSTSKWQSWDKR